MIYVQFATREEVTHDVICRSPTGGATIYVKLFLQVKVISLCIPRYPKHSMYPKRQITHAYIYN